MIQLEKGFSPANKRCRQRCERSIPCLHWPYLVESSNSRFVDWLTDCLKTACLRHSQSRKQSATFYRNVDAHQRWTTTAMTMVKTRQLVCGRTKRSGNRMELFCPPVEYDAWNVSSTSFDVMWSVRYSGLWASWTLLLCHSALIILFTARTKLWEFLSSVLHIYHYGFFV